MKGNIKPLGSKVVVERKEAKTTKGGILLPDSAQQKPRQGIVKAVGPGKTDDKGRHHPVEVQVGDEVLFSSYAGTEYKTDATEYLILSEDEILAIMN